MKHPVQSINNQEVQVEEMKQTVFFFFWVRHVPLEVHTLLLRLLHIWQQETIAFLDFVDKLIHNTQQSEDMTFSEKDKIS